MLITLHKNARTTPPLSVLKSPPVTSPLAPSLSASV